MELMNIEKYTKYLIQTMKDNGVNCLSATFEGCGDSGEITEIKLHTSNAKINAYAFTEKAKEMMITATVIKFTATWSTSTITSFEEESISLYDFFNQYVEYLSHRDGINWWDNGGGKGELYLNLKEDRFEFNIETYETETPVYSEGTIQDWMDEMNEEAESE